MAYCLEKRAVQGAGKPPQIIWEQYATCGSRALLERVRTGQKHPEHWRVRPERTCGSTPAAHISWLKTTPHKLALANYD